MATASNLEHVGKYKVKRDAAHTIGRGRVGVVYRAKNIFTRHPVAAKLATFANEYLSGEEFQKEAEIMKHMPEHKNIAKVYDFMKTEYVDQGVPMLDLWLFTEFCCYGDLKMFARQRALTNEQKLDLMHQSAVGVSHLHEQGIAHRNLKPENILLTDENDEPVVKICDCGPATVYKRVAGFPVSMKTRAANVSYAAPEEHSFVDAFKILLDKRPVDLFSLGAIFLALLESSLGATMQAKCVNGHCIGTAAWFMNLHAPGIRRIRIDYPSDSPFEAAIKSIIMDMIRFEPSDRIPIGEVVERLRKLSESTVKEAPEPAEAVKTNTVAARQVSAHGEVFWAVKKSSLWVRQDREWDQMPDMPVGPVWGRTVVRVYDGIIVLGGLIDNEVSEICFHFSLLTLDWKMLPFLNIARCGASGAVLGDVVLVLGGHDKLHQNLDVCETLHLGNLGSWSPAASMLRPLWRPLVAAAAGKLFVLPQERISPDTRMQVYEPTANSFILASQLPEHIGSTDNASLVGVGDLLFLVGGERKLALQYCPAVDQWSHLLSQPRAEYWFGCEAVVYHNKLLLCGGKTDYHDCNLVEEFDMETLQWKAADFTLPFGFSAFHTHVGSLRIPRISGRVRRPLTSSSLP